MEIEKIIKLKNGLYNVIVKKDLKEHQFTLNENLIIKNKLYKNKKLTLNEFENLNQLVVESKLYTAALNYISYKMRAESEVRHYLKEKNCDNNTLIQIIDKLKNLNYIDDVNYSKSYTKYQFEVNKKGPNLIKQELLNKKVDIKYIENSLAKLENDSLENTIQSLIIYYDKINKNKSIKKLKDSILRNLIIKGFDYQMSLALVNKYNFTNHNDEENILATTLVKIHHKLVKKYENNELKKRIIKTLLNKGFNYDDILKALDSFLEK